MTDQNGAARIDSGGNLQHELCRSFDREPDGGRMHHRQWEGQEGRGEDAPCGRLKESGGFLHDEGPYR